MYINTTKLKTPLHVKLLENDTKFKNTPILRKKYSLT